MLVTKKAPDFKTLAVMGDNSIKEVSLSDIKSLKNKIKLLEIKLSGIILLD